MQKFRKWLILLLVVFSMISIANNVWAYDAITTHPSLTEIIIKKYNQDFVKDLNDEAIYWLKKGSTDEDYNCDILIRSANHFYDPIYKDTWRLQGVEQVYPNIPANLWAQD